MKLRPTAIVLPWFGKSPACRRTVNMSSKRNHFALAFHGGILIQLPDCDSEVQRQGTGEGLSKPADQVAHFHFQSPGNLRQRIHRRGFFSALNPADEDGRKPGFLRQFFLAETGGFTPGANGFTQKAAVWLAGRHDLLKEQESESVTMSLTTILLAGCRSRN